MWRGHIYGQVIKLIYEFFQGNLWETMQGLTICVYVWVCVCVCVIILSEVILTGLGYKVMFTAIVCSLFLGLSISLTYMPQ